MWTSNGWFGTNKQNFKAEKTSDVSGLAASISALNPGWAGKDNLKESTILISLQESNFASLSDEQLADLAHRHKNARNKSSLEIDKNFHKNKIDAIGAEQYKRLKKNMGIEESFKIGDKVKASADYPAAAKGTVLDVNSDYVKVQWVGAKTPAHVKHSSVVKESENLDEVEGSTKRNREFLATGRISKDEFDRRMDYGKYSTKPKTDMEAQKKDVASRIAAQIIRTHAAVSKHVKDFNTKNEETVEDLEELNKKTLGSYIKGASSDLTNIQREVDRVAYKSPEYVKMSKLRSNRKAGIKTAVDKIIGEGVNGDGMRDGYYVTDHMGRIIHDKNIPLTFTKASKLAQKHQDATGNYHQATEMKAGKIGKVHGYDALKQKFVTHSDYAGMGVTFNESIDDLDEGNSENKVKKNIYIVKLGNDADVSRLNHNKNLVPLKTRAREHDDDDFNDDYSRQEFRNSSLKNALAKMKRAGRAEQKYGKDAGYIQTLNDFGKNVRKEEIELTSEELELVNELNKKTLGSYIKKAPANATSTKFQAIAHTERSFEGGIDQDAHELMSDKLHRRYDNRIKGVSKATDKILAKEEIEDLDESWQNGIATYSVKGVYTKKAKENKTKADLADRKGDIVGYHRSMANYVKNSYHAGRWGSQVDAKKDHKFHMDAIKEFKTNMKESVEDINEISKELVKSYLQKSKLNVKALGKDKKNLDKKLDKDADYVTQKYLAARDGDRAPSSKAWNSAASRMTAANKKIMTTSDRNDVLNQKSDVQRKISNRYQGAGMAMDRMHKEGLDETTYERGLEDHEARVVHGVMGVKSRPFSKKFKSADHMNKWLDHDDNVENVDISHIERA